MTITAVITAVLVTFAPGQPNGQLAAFLGESGPGLCNLNAMMLNPGAEEQHIPTRYRCDLLEPATHG